MSKHQKRSRRGAGDESDWNDYRQSDRKRKRRRPKDDAFAFVPAPFLDDEFEMIPSEDDLDEFLSVEAEDDDWDDLDEESEH